MSKGLLLDLVGDHDRLRNLLDRLLFLLAVLAEELVLGDPLEIQRGVIKVEVTLLNRRGNRRKAVFACEFGESALILLTSVGYVDGFNWLFALLWRFRGT